ncbi:chromosome segregation protein SMC [Alteribacter keqinensis]|uniref:Chromosome partition protein Smc n=1 Tax=Alteribacter keqinensis TaxID=2483800 RepID=A0A3M7TYX1_9BACI|nr:chromosome segregation protein SMC [Alteribacter keqinensis]RNA69625.1 chromosome segregation protein SMC [Alteribacter keqinensis]
MFLKRLDLVGFKSFADRLSIDFVSGVTAVVGPNGSGKSNISDGIRWVLGEQSAKNLRGGKMEDIIFSGTDLRKPLNMAEITLTLNNEEQHLAIDYSEVSVTRRVYRSGESEYLINKQPCRLRDIVDLFMDSGLGRESFSIIGQGKIEEILSSKPEERRKIFEEAAGVLKYKTRKLKSEKKLADTQDNLNRVEDILYELHGQVEPLREQASVAKEYLEKKAELEKFEIGLFVKEIEHLHEKWTAEKEKLVSFREKEENLTRAVKEKEDAVEAFRSDIQDIEDSIQKLQDVLLNTSEELEKQEGQKQVWKERKKNFAKNREQFQEELEKLKEQKEKLARECDVQSEKAEAAKKQLKRTEKERKKQEALYEKLSEDTEEKIESLKGEYIEYLNEAASLKNEKRYLTEQLEKQSFKEERLEQENKDLLVKREHYTRDKEKQDEYYARIKEEIDQSVTLFRNLQAKLEHEEQEYRKKETLLYEAYRHAEQLRSKKEFMEDMQSDYSGFFQGVKEILKERDRKSSGIEGAVAELIDVKKEHETALDIALGAAQQHVVVQNEATGRKAIGFLKQRGLGRATFLPMDVMKPRTLPSGDLTAVSNHPAFAGVAKDLVSFDERYENVIGQLLGNVIVAQDLKGANEIARLVRYRFRIVTLEGDVINPGGGMTGGSMVKKKSQLLGRQQELERMTAKLTRLEQDVQKAEADVKNRKARLSALQQEADLARKRGEATRDQEQDEKGKSKELELAINSLNDRLQIYDQEKEEFERERKEKESRLKELDEAITAAVEKTEELNKEIQRVSKKQAEQAVSKESLSKELTNLRIMETKEQEQLHYLEQSLTSLTESFNDVKKDLSYRTEEYDQLRREIDSQADDGETLEEIIAKRKQEKEQTIRLISKRKSDRLGLQQDHDDTEVVLREYKRQLKQMSDAVHETEVLVNRTDVELDNRLAKLEGEYELTFEAAKAKDNSTLSIEETRTKVKLIKLAIEELGSVNVGAIEEYDRVKERHDFLKEQKEDLEHGKATLLQVIEEMDSEMIRRFKETFYQIQEHFRDVFVQLFGGGRADLVLTNPDDLLATGVDIVAQPPGKKLQNLGLLSGGERALTAIALLFGILKTRPVPFCVLDEVEAALDDANVARFAQYLKEFSRDTQFIVVTHRKGTMEEADVLYGVTMQESGVSNLVSVRLEETEALVGSD